MSELANAIARLRDGDVMRWNGARVRLVRGRVEVAYGWSATATYKLADAAARDMGRWYSTGELPKNAYVYNTKAQKAS